MDIQLKELIETIKKEGIDSADTQTAEILAEAKKKAAAIEAKAREEAAELLAAAKRDIARDEQTSRDALSQAARDLLLNLESKIVGLFDTVVKNAVSEALSGKGLEDILSSVLTVWVEKRSSDIEVLLPKAELEKLEKTLVSRLGETLKKGVVLKPLSQVDAGFRIGEKDGSSYYDFTSDGVAEILSEYLNPRLAEILKNAVKKEG
jgi:V/A-type H+-transporting ATPase subunit E